jgi:F-type H+-transporting ATPase subunit b
MAQMHRTTGACELKNKALSALFAACLVIFAPAFAAAQEHPPAAPTQAAQPEGEHAPAEGEHHDQSIGGMILGMGWQVANFIVFVGVLYYFLNKPIREYLASRHSAIRKDLVEAAELRAAANDQLAKIDAKLKALPGELHALRVRGAEEITSEEQRIAQQAAADRDRLLEQTRREIDLQVRLAKKEILEHAANLSVQLATERIKKDVTPADQERLIDRYLTQVKEER